ncbi:hypothetical protein F2P81_004200 [Scophthalmus maximus]|uniref:Uncharacterized protein n=1 Tax=Scophthalmus maximus TaxID=52904 RepID=A0A6A4TA08_SCOMX|nr:hypothetical protein F2P81_004200 [Scophthalmus maximus]
MTLTFYKPASDESCHLQCGPLPLKSQRKKLRWYADCPHLLISIRAELCQKHFPVFYFTTIFHVIVWKEVDKDCANDSIPHLATTASSYMKYHSYVLGFYDSMFASCRDSTGLCKRYKRLHQQLQCAAGPSPTLSSAMKRNGMQRYAATYKQKNIELHDLFLAEFPTELCCIFLITQGFDCDMSRKCVNCQPVGNTAVGFIIILIILIIIPCQSIVWKTCLFSNVVSSDIWRAVVAAEKPWRDDLLGSRYNGWLRNPTVTRKNGKTDVNNCD